jgi:PAS domain-containing protein
MNLKRRAKAGSGRLIARGVDLCVAQYHHPLGREESELIGRPLTELFIMQEQEQAGQRSLLFHLNARSGFTDLALRAAKDGDEQWWAVNGRPVYDAFNNFLAFAVRAAI